MKCKKTHNINNHQSALSPSLVIKSRTAEWMWLNVNTDACKLQRELNCDGFVIITYHMESSYILGTNGRGLYLTTVSKYASWVCFHRDPLRLRRNIACKEQHDVYFHLANCVTLKVIVELQRNAIFDKPNHIISPITHANIGRNTSSLPECKVQIICKCAYTFDYCSSVLQFDGIVLPQKIHFIETIDSIIL